MIDSVELREACAQQLSEAANRVPQITAFVGLDGFVDEILHVVDKREDAEHFQRMSTIAQLAQRFAAAAGRSTNIEVVPHTIKLGGNGPIMANALASFGIDVTYLGCLGYPTLNPVFKEFAQRANVHSIADPGHTDALEFDDGKIMVGKHFYLKDVNWENIKSRYGKERLLESLRQSTFLGFVNWTMLPYMSDVWESMLTEIFPNLSGARRKVFFDLADPEKRTKDDILRALDLIGRFEEYFEVILGLNEKEANEIGDVLGLASDAHDSDSVEALATSIAAKLPVSTLVVHPVKFAVAISGGTTTTVRGLYTRKPKITTGAGDHFNAGFCLGKLLGLEDDHAILSGVTTSGYYVRTGQSPTVQQLADQLRNWTNED